MRASVLAPPQVVDKPQQERQPRVVRSALSTNGLATEPLNIDCPDRYPHLLEARLRTRLEEVDHVSNQTFIVGREVKLRWGYPLRRTYVAALC